jgi:hypothetical protein
MARNGYILSDDFDLVIEGGVFKKGETTEQSVQLVILGAPGFIRQYPLMGFNVIRYHKAKADKKQKFESELSEHLALADFKLEKLELNTIEWWKDFKVQVTDELTV